MIDSAFFTVALSPSLLEIAQMVDAHLAVDETPSPWRASGLASLETAGPGDISFCANARHAHALATTRAGACLLRASDGACAPEGTIALLTDDPARAFARLAATLCPSALRPPTGPSAGISIGATIDASARLEVGASIAPGVFIGRRVEIGTGTAIGPHSIIGDGVRIGRDCTVGPQVTVTHALIGDRVVIHTGARIGQDGFGFVPGPRGHGKVAQLGRVIIQDDVEIGANTTIDRGTLDDTIIGEGTKIDNLVQIAHNVVVGRHCLFAAQVGIAGSTRIGDFVAIGGQAGIGGHLSVGAGARIAGKSGVLHDVPARGQVGGSPATPVSRWLRAAVQARRDARAK